MDISLSFNPSKREAYVQARSGKAQAKKEAGTNRADRLALSRQAIAYLQENSRRIQEELLRTPEERGTAGKSGDESLLKSLDKTMDVMKKCEKIAASIIKGKRVPPEDLQYLMEHDPNGFKLAMALRRPARDDEEVESVLDDEDREGEAAEGTAEPSAEPCEASCEDAAPSGDGN